MFNEVSFIDENILYQDDVNVDSPAFTSKKTLKDKNDLQRFLIESDDLKSLLLWLEYAGISTEIVKKSSLLALILKTINELDRSIEKQINHILHHTEFQALESSWRSLSYLVDQKESLDKDQKVKIKLLDCDWNTLSKDLNKAIEFDQSQFFKLLYSNEYDMSGGEPFGVIVGDYHVTHIIDKQTRIDDIDTLKELAKVCSAVFAPFITSAKPAFFGVNNFSDLGAYIDWSKTFDQVEYIKWQALRDMEESRFLGITLPNILMRKPYEYDGTRSEGFRFKEHIKDPQQDNLWGNAAYAFASVLLRAFTESAWFGQIRGMQPGFKSKGLVCDLPVSQYETDKYQKHNKPSINLQIGDKTEKALSDNGFIPLSPINGCDHLVFFSNASVQKPPIYETAEANVNAKLSSMLQYILCVSRFAHYIKVQGREKLGSYRSAEVCESELQSWLHKYTTASDSVSDDVRCKYPLYSAKVKIKEMLGKPGHFFSVIQLQPHFQLDQMISSLKLVTEFSPQNN